MAIKKYYVGSAGPFKYDDAEYINDPDGDFSGEYQEAGRTNGTYKADQAPADNQDMVRLEDLNAVAVAVEVDDITNPTEIESISGSNGKRVLAFQTVSNDRNYFTVYAHDSDGPAENIPTIVDAGGDSSERWIAIGGKYVAGDLAEHNSQHESGGSDEINVDGLSGDLADAQDPKTHSTSHESTGGDALFDQNLNSTNSVTFSDVTASYNSSDGSGGWSGTFTNGDGQTVTVKDGIITDVS